MSNVPPLLPPGQGVPPVIGSSPKPPPLPFTQGPPFVVVAYRCWCVFIALIYLAMCFYSIQIARGRIEPSLGLLEGALTAPGSPERAQIIDEKRKDAPGMVVFTAAIALVYVAAAAVIRRTPSFWVFGLVVLCTTTCPLGLTVAGMVPLIIFWARPETKRYFNRKP